jgi:hypothetical protein
VRFVSYVYGDSLKQANGRCITNAAELDKLGSTYEEFACYVVEVCLDCGWNHLDRRYLLGRQHTSPTRRPDRTREPVERLHPSRAGLSPG